MEIGYKTGCLMLLGALGALCSSGAEFPVRHVHFKGKCVGTMTVDASGVSFAGPKQHAWKWKLEDIRELKLGPEGIYLLSYQRGYQFTGEIPAAELYELLRPRMDQRLVFEAGSIGGLTQVLWSAPVKHAARRAGSEGTLAFGEEGVVYATAATSESRTWRYADIDNISSTGPFQLTITTFERSRWDYDDRRDFSFALKRPITEASYNQIWLQIERKNGKIP